MTKCSKCDGTGKVMWLHIDNGRCFDCAGSGRRAAVIGATPACGIRTDDRQSFINRFAAVLRAIKREGGAFLSEPCDAQAPELGTERDNLRAWLNSPRCPDDVRSRAIAAFVAAGVEI